MKENAVIFDLDGTLVNTLPGLAESINILLRAEGYEEHPVDAYRQFVGNGIHKTMKRAFQNESLPDTDIEQYIRIFNENYETRWTDMSKPYAGVTDMLQEFADSGVFLSVVSNKPHRFTCLMVEEFFRGYSFGAVFGARDSVPVKPAPDGALEAAESMGVRPEECFFVGDSCIDIETAEAADMTSIGAAWGFRGREELEQSGADFIAESAEEIPGIVSGSRKSKK